MPFPLIDVRVERPAAGGRMIARHEGRVMLVADAIPGERVRVAIERVQKQVAWARVVEVVEPSPDRRPPHCDLACGCEYAHIAYARQCALKADIVADVFRRIGKVALERAVPVTASPEAGYRLRARVHVEERRWGFFREATHVLCDAVSTRQLLPETSEAIDRAVAALAAAGVAVADVSVAENVPATERVLHVELKPAARWPKDLRVEPIPGLSGMSVAAGDGRAQVVWGADTVTDELAGDADPTPVSPAPARWTRRATSFFQGNRFLLDALVRRVVDAAAGARVVDLYAGVGLFSVAIALRGSSVVAVEGDRSSGEDLERNALAHAGRIDVRRRAVEEVVRQDPPIGLDAVIVDPPRQGLSAEALGGLIAWRAPRIVYVSCDPATLARDARRLLDAGHRLIAIEALDLFPNTSHIETIAVFDGAGRASN